MSDFLSKALSRSVSFHNINQEIINWDYSDLEGEGFYYKPMSTKYGHVKIKFSKGENENVKIYWNENAPIPTEFRDGVTKVLSFFVSYMEGLKGENVSLKIEILDGSYHLIDSNKQSFELATLFALHDCFGKPRKEITQQDRNIIRRFRENFK